MDEQKPGSWHEEVWREPDWARCYPHLIGFRNPEGYLVPLGKRSLRSVLQEEDQYMRSLQINDGQGRGPTCPTLRPAYINTDDEDTPDNQIPHTKESIRLTEKYPLNAEPPYRHMTLRLP
ncbi:hypothetical protein MPDQ_006080 [Monascus purpureus]|uniref:Uncharacterized protein n=1 Tax=Monascus purpureus TaxID=5098 RepID=A0A507QVI5_MONPU|nr:hypothetical protein MPDQ_006080 [Monascus purpureus]